MTEKDRSIIMSAPMILALLARRKTQTRRLALEKWREVEDMSSEEQEARDAAGQVFHFRSDGRVRAWTRPTKWTQAKPGEFVWVRETIWRRDVGEFGRKQTQTIYRATDEAALEGRFKPGSAKWTPAIHMRRTESRITIELTEVRRQFLHDISYDDVVAEGPELVELHDQSGESYLMVPIGTARHASPRAWYHTMWDTLHGEGAWEENPQVVALSFRVHLQNIDAVPRVAA